MDYVSLEEHNRLQQRVYNIHDKTVQMELAAAELTGRIKSAESSIDRLQSQSATAEQLASATTITNLKLDHLLEKHVAMDKRLLWAARTVVGFVLSVGVGIAVWYFTR